MFSFRKEIGIDLGTASVLVFIKGKGIVLSEPSVVAIDTNTDKVLAVGKEAQNMLGRTPGHIAAIRPLKDGVISDFSVTERMLRYFINKTCGLRRLFGPRIIICVPSGVTEVEKRAVLDAAMAAGGGKTYLIEEPIAAAIGANLDIAKPGGSMIVDIGGGTTDVAVISLGGIVVSNSIKTAGDEFDEAIKKYMREKYKLIIGERTAEELKINIGTAFPREKAVSMACKGRDMLSGLPKSIMVSSTEMEIALKDVVEKVCEVIHGVLEKTPPELAADITETGIIMTGGGSLLYGLNRIIEQRTGIKTIIADDAVSCVAKGTGRSLEHFDVLQRAGNKGAKRYN